MQETNSGSSFVRFSFDTAAVWILAIVAFLATVLFIPGSPISLSGTKVAVIAFGALIAFIAYLVARLVRGNVVFPPLLLLGAVWLLPVAYGLSTLFSGTNPLNAVFGVELETDTFGFTLALALLASLAALAMRQASHYKLFLLASGAAVVVTFLAQIGFVIAARLGVSGISAATNLIGAFSDLAYVAGIAVAVSLIALRFLSLSAKWKGIFYAAIALGLLVLALANSVLSWVLVGIVALGLFIEAVMRRRATGADSDLEGISTIASEEESEGVSSEGRTLGAPLVTLLITLFFLIGGSSIGNAFAASLGINVIDVRPSWQATFEVGSHTYASSPIFGSGPGTFGEQWLSFRDRALNDTIFWNVDFGTGIGHIPTSFITTGLLGVIAWLLLIGLFIYTGVRALLFRMPADSFMRFVSLASFTVAAFVFAAALFGAPGPTVLAIGFLFLGLFISSLRFGKGRLDWGIVFAKAPRLGFAIVFAMTLVLLSSVGGVYLVLERYLGNLAYGEAATALASGNLDAADTAIARSIDFAPTERAYQLQSAIGVERMRRVAADTTLTPSVAQQQFQASLSGAIASAQNATTMGPKDYQNWVVLGSVYQSVAVLGIEGSYEAAKDAFERALALNPTSPVLPFVIAQLEIGQGNGQAAEERLLASIAAKRDYIPAILLLSQLSVQLGKATEALQAAEAAAFFAPNDPSVLFQVGLLRAGTGDIPGGIAALSRAVELNTQYANARFFLGAFLATRGEYAAALEQFRAVATLSPENAAAVAQDIAALEEGTNPFTQARLRTLGIPQPPVAEPEPQQ